ncbi:SCP-2 sterol transfer family protein [Micromonospora pallida]|uniref:SCP-2 sterol transfer family protein n=2 Tax=Micromonospora pallida TaxID=145854 RepID=A0A1C6SRR8_9ACTN|nr:SCP-2 sterol transfer family protein [Micromonospora pallida]
MVGPATEFLAHQIAGRYAELPETAAGTLRLDISENGWTDHWYLTLDRQSVRVTRSADEAELVVRGDQEVFDQLVTGRTAITSALMRNELVASGRLPLLLILRRLFPGPPGARHPRDIARQEGRR